MFMSIPPDSMRKTGSLMFYGVIGMENWLKCVKHVVFVFHLKPLWTLLKVQV